MAFCEHVYIEKPSDTCDVCGKHTHKIDWKQQHKLHEEWIASGKAELQGWWSI